MKPYGIPRIKDTVYPDKADIKLFGFSTVDRCSKKDRGKNKARRMWKKRERSINKQSLRRQLNE